MPKVKSRKRIREISAQELQRLRCEVEIKRIRRLLKQFRTVLKVGARGNYDTARQNERGDCIFLWQLPCASSINEGRIRRYVGHTRALYWEPNGKPPLDPPLPLALRSYEYTDLRQLRIDLQSLKKRLCR